jgi:hypothetical protein
MASLGRIYLSRRNYYEAEFGKLDEEFRDFISFRCEYIRIQKGSSESKKIKVKTSARDLD